MTARAYNNEGGFPIRLYFSRLIPRRRVGAGPGKTAIAASIMPHQMNERMIQTHVRRSD